jgi:hypothetical protein
MSDSFLFELKQLKENATAGPFTTSGVRVRIQNWGHETQVHRLLSETEGDIALFPCGYKEEHALKALADSKLACFLLNNVDKIEVMGKEIKKLRETLNKIAFARPAGPTSKFVSGALVEKIEKIALSALAENVNWDNLQKEPTHD